MSGRGRTPIFSFEGFDTPSRRTASSNRSRVPSARDVLNGIVNAGTTPSTPASTTDHTDSGEILADTGDTSVTNAVKHLRDQQRKLQASTARIEDMLKQLTENHEKNVTASVTRPGIPRALSVSKLVCGLMIKVSETVYRELSMMCMISCLMTKRK